MKQTPRQRLDDCNLKELTEILLQKEHAVDTVELRDLMVYLLCPQSAVGITGYHQESNGCCKGRGEVGSKVCNECWEKRANTFDIETLHSVLIKCPACSNERYVHEWEMATLAKMSDSVTIITTIKRAIKNNIGLCFYYCPVCDTREFINKLLPEAF